jgi:hypothetical protein
VTRWGTSRFPQTPSPGPLRGQALRAGSDPGHAWRRPCASARRHGRSRTVTAAQPPVWDGSGV